MAPPLTSKDPAATSLPSMPDHGQDPTAEPDRKQSAPAPASTPVVQSPKETGAPLLHQGPSQVASAGDPATPTASPGRPTDSPASIYIDPNQNTGIRQGLDQGASQTESTGPKQSESGDHGKDDPNVDPGLPNDPQQSQDSTNGAIAASTIDAAIPQSTHQEDNASPNLGPSDLSQNRVSQTSNVVVPAQSNLAATGGISSAPQSGPEGGDPSPSNSVQPAGGRPWENPAQNNPNQPESPTWAPGNSGQSSQGSPGAPAHDGSNHQSNSPEQVASPSTFGLQNGGTSGDPEKSSPDQQSDPPGGHYSPDAFASSKPSSPGSSPEQLTSPGDNVSPALSNSFGNNAPALPVTTLSVAGYAVAVGPSALHVDGSQISPQPTPVSISGGAVINQGSTVVLGNQIYHIPSAEPASATTIAGNTVSPIANGAVVNGKTITAGASATTVSGTPILVDSSNQIHFGDSSYQLPTPGPLLSTSLPNGAPAVVFPNAVSVHGTTLSAGSPAVTISGTVVSLDSSNNLIYGATAVALPSMIRSLSLDSGPSIGQVTIVNAQPIVPLTQGISIAGTTLTPGAPPITVSNTPISFESSSLMIGTSSIALRPQAPSLLNPPIAGKTTIINGHPVVPLPEGISIAGTTRTPGASPISVSNTPISLGSSALVIGTSSVSLAAPSPTATPLITTIAGQLVTADAGVVVVTSKTSPGISISGTPVSLDSAGQLMVGSSTISFVTPVAKPLVTTIAGQALTADRNAVLLASSTLTPGASAITLSGTPVSLDSSGELVIGSGTIALGSSSNTLDDSIVSGFRTGIPSAFTSSLPLQTGSSITIGSAAPSRTDSPVKTAAAICKSGLLDLRWRTMIIFVITAIFAMIGL